jgi:hypothetical protein
MAVLWMLQLEVCEDTDTQTHRHKEIPQAYLSRLKITLKFWNDSNLAHDCGRPLVRP